MLAAGSDRLLGIMAVAIRLAIAVALLPLALDWRSPFLAAIRPYALAGLVALPVLLIAAEIRLLRTHRAKAKAARGLGMLTLALAVIGLTSTLLTEGHFWWMRHRVLHADADQLERIGRHLVVGYRHKAELIELLKRHAIAGVFLSAVNVHGRGIEEIKQGIQALQEIRARQNLPPLWIATDQEGGGVSRLSPPLARLPPISEIVRRHPEAAERRIAIGEYATAQGRELAGLGVNLNFAPVVDLDHRIVTADDRYTRIFERAISDDAAVVTAVAGEYCAALWRVGVRCTLKHFPGLGRVRRDTHLGGADLEAPLDELEATDWVPFRALMKTGAFIMLGHARLLAIDRDHPASFSQAVVAQLLRGRWGLDGVLITDDFSMGAVHGSREGISGAAVAALNAGVDLILISYDPDEYYPVMHALLQADRDGRLRRDVLARSDERLGSAARTGMRQPDEPSPLSARDTPRPPRACRPLWPYHGHSLG